MKCLVVSLCVIKLTAAHYSKHDCEKRGQIVCLMIHFVMAELYANGGMNLTWLIRKMGLMDFLEHTLKTQYTKSSIRHSETERLQDPVKV